MSYDMTVIERLEHVLNEKDRDLEKAQEELEFLRAHATWEWSRHGQIDADDDPLPVPRLELEALNVSGNWYITDWVYRIVYAHFLGHHVTVPIGHTRQTGGRGLSPSIDDTPFRETEHFKHDAEAFAWPAYILVEGIVVGTIEDMKKRHEELRRLRDRYNA